MDYNRLLNLSTDLGFLLLESGGEIYRVEESVQRLLAAYGLRTGEAFVIPNCITVSLVTPDGQALTRVRQMPTHGTDIDLLERCNDLCRRLCRDTPPLDEALAGLDAVTQNPRRFSLPVQLFGHFLGAGAFALFFGGTLLDGLCAGLCGLTIAFCLIFMTNLGTNLFFKTVAAGALSALLALIFCMVGLGQNVDLITIGALMLLVPGLIF
ncbi:MAG: threonine/serine exporter family protein, partial [Pseudoflavonifractor sp.]